MTKVHPPQESSASPEPIPVKDFMLRKPSLHFEVFCDETARWRWRLSMADGTVMGEAPSAFADRRACLESVERIRQSINAPIHER